MKVIKKTIQLKSLKHISHNAMLIRDRLRLRIHVPHDISRQLRQKTSFLILFFSRVFSVKDAYLPFHAITLLPDFIRQMQDLDQNHPLLSQKFKGSVTALLVVLVIFGAYPHAPENVLGAYSTSTTDADGITHLASNTVNETKAYDLSGDSSESSQQVLGADPNWKNGISRKSYSLSLPSGSTSDYASVANNTSFAVGSGSFTVEAWVRPTASAAMRVANNYSDPCGTPLGWLFDVNTSTNVIRLKVTDGTNNIDYSASASVTVNAWQHVAGVVDRGTQTIRIYLNGTLVGTSSSISSVGSLTNSAALGIGLPLCVQGAYTGYIDEVRLSNSVRYSSNFSSVRRYTADDSTLGLWHFDEGTSTSVSDSSINGNSASLAGSASWATGANAVMDSFAGCSPDTGITAACSVSGRSGAGNLTLGSNSSVSSDKSYEVKISGSNGLSFDGSNDYVNVPNSASLTLSSTPFTMEAWVKLNALPGSTGYFIHKLSGNFGYRVGINTSGAVTATRGTGSGVITQTFSTNPLSVGRWYHVAYLYDGSSSYITVNGSLSGKITFAGLTSDTTALSINNSSAPLNMVIDEVRISNSLRYSSNFTAQRRFATDANTMALYHFDEGSGQTVADASGNENNGTLGASSSSASDDPSWVEALPATSDNPSQSSSAGWALPGYQYREKMKITNNVASTLNPGYGVETTKDRGAKIDAGQARADGKDWRVVYQPSSPSISLSFNGTNNYVDVPQGSGINTTGAVTVEAWVKLNSLASENGIIQMGAMDDGNANTNQQYSLYTNTSGNLVFAYEDVSTNNVAYTSTGALATGQWYHVAATRNASNLVAFYINGVASGSTSGVAAGTSTQTINLNLGYVKITGGSDRYLNGSLDEVRVSSAVRYAAVFSPSTVPFVADSTTGALWHLDEASGTTAVDVSGNQNNGILTNSPTWSTTDGVVTTSQEVPRTIPHGHDVQFNGSTQFGTMSSSAGLSSATTFTIEAWVKLGAISGTQVVYASQVNGGGNSRAQLHVNSNGTVQYSFRPSDGGTQYDLISTTALSANTWYHLAVTHDTNRSLQRLYINGTQAATGSNVGTFASSASGCVSIAANPTSCSSVQNPLNGQLDEIRISNTVRYNNNFTPSTNPFGKDSSTIGLWHIDDGSGTSLVDSSGNGYTISLTGTPTWATNGGYVDSINQTQFKTVAPIASSGTDTDYYLYYGNNAEQGSAQSYSSYGLKFDGTNDYVQFANQSNYQFGNTTFAVSLRFNTTTSATATMIAKGGYTTGWIIRMSGGKLEALLKNGGNSADDRFSSSTVNNGVWHHAVVVFTTNTSTQAGNTISIYIDGSLDQGTETNNSVAYATGSGPLVLGYRSDLSDGYYTGSLDDMRIYSRSLSSTEVTNLNTNTPTVSNFGLVASWQLDQTTPASTTASDSSSSSNTGTLNNFNFNSSSNWIVNSSLLHASTEPTVTFPVTAGAEQETPLFFMYRDVSTTGTAGSWSTAAAITPSTTQLGSTGVYVSFNPQGIYSVNDYYKINSWAIEAFSTTVPRGKKRAFPAIANLVASNGGLDIIDGQTNKVWMRLPVASNNMVGSSNLTTVDAKNGHVYVGSLSGLYDIDFVNDRAFITTSSGTDDYSANIAGRRNTDSTGVYSVSSGTSLSNTSVNDLATAVNTVTAGYSVQNVAVATADKVTLMQNTTGSSSKITYTSNGAGTVIYTDVALTSAGRMYAASSTASNLQINTSTQNDSSNQTSADITYSTASTPALSSGTINDIQVSESSSIADAGVSNQVTLALAVGVDLLDEHTTQSSAVIRRHVKEGTLGSSGWSSRQFGGALYTNGSSTYATLNSSAGIAANRDNSTIEAWVNIANTTGIQKIYSENGTAGGSQALFITSGKVALSIYNTATTTTYTATGATTLTPGTWYHIAGVYDQAQTGGYGLRVYVNGVLDGTDANQSHLSAANRVEIGRNYNGGTPTEYYNGRVDEVRVSNSSRYTTDTFTVPTEQFLRDTNTLRLWHFNERFDQNLYDESSSNSNGFLGSSTSVGSDDALRILPSIAGTQDNVQSAGVVRTTGAGKALSYDGGDYVSVPDASSIKFGSGDFTLEAWVKLGTQTSSFPAIINKEDGSGTRSGYSLLAPASGGFGGVNFQAWSSNAASAVTGPDIRDSQWHHVAGVKTSTALRLYVDGSLVGTASHSLGSTDKSTTLYIGSFAGSQGVVGTIDEVRISNAALYSSNFTPQQYFQRMSSTALLMHFDEGSGQSVSDSSTNANNGTLGSSSSVGADDPSWSTDNLLRYQGVLWAGTNGSGTGGLTAISTTTDRQITTRSTSNSGLPGNNITSISLTSSGLGLVGTDSGAWNPGAAGFVVDDTSASNATSVGPVRAKSGGTVRVKSGGSVRIKGGQ